MRRRRVGAFLVLAGVGAIAAASTTSWFGGKKAEAPAVTERKIELPRGGTDIFPNFRVVAYYGSAFTGDRNTKLGVLGTGTPTEVAERLADTAADYDSYARPVLPAFQLIATLALENPGDDKRYRSRLTDAQIDKYLHAARQEKAILILDIQPGRADFMDEVRHFRHYLEMPDVSLALDPEWSMGPNEVPAEVYGHTDAKKINEVSAYLSEIVQTKRLPQKLLVIHEFREDLIRNKRAIVQRPGLAMVFNVDGVGTPDAKTGKYIDLTTDPTRPAGVFTGFKLFYSEDADTSRLGSGARLMEPIEVLDLDPSPDVIVYE